MSSPAMNPNCDSNLHRVVLFDGTGPQSRRPDFGGHENGVLTNSHRKSDMASTIPTSTHLVESTVIAAPLTTVWGLIKLAKFDQWFSALESSKSAKETSSDEVQCFDWKFKDGSTYQVKQEGHSCALVLQLRPICFFIPVRSTDCRSWTIVMANPTAIDHFIQYSVIAAEPALPYSVSSRPSPSLFTSLDRISFIYPFHRSPWPRSVT